MFNVSKIAGKQGYFTHTGVGKVRPKKEVPLESIENWAAEGKTRKQMARELKMTYGYLCRRINESDSLSKAEKRGREKWSISND